MPADGMAASSSSTGAAIATAHVLSAEDYERVRPRYRPYVLALKHRRRVRLGRHASLLFESYETVLYHVHEILRVEGRTTDRVARLVDEYACLLPGPDRLCATLMIDGDDERACARLARRAARTGAIELVVDGLRLPSARTCTPTTDDEPVRYLRLAVPPEVRASLGHPGTFVRLHVDDGDDRSFEVPSRLRVALFTDLSHRHALTRLPSLLSRPAHSARPESA